jgi:hypothetical protein
MKKSIWLLSVSAALPVVALLALSAAAAEHRSSHPGGSRPAKSTPAKPTTQNEQYAVVEIGDEIKSIRVSDIPNEKKRVAEDYKKAMKEWNDLKKSDPQAERPPKLSVKTLKQGFNTQKGADEYRDKLLEKTGKGDKAGARPKAH